jgi:hypothetical protein
VSDQVLFNTIEHTKTKAGHPQTNGICERFHRTMKEEFYDVTMRKKFYEKLEDLQQDADEWLKKYNEIRPHSGKYCYGKTPMQTFLDGKKIVLEKVFEGNNMRENEVDNDLIGRPTS